MFTVFFTFPTLAAHLTLNKFCPSFLFVLSFRFVHTKLPSVDYTIFVSLKCYELSGLQSKNPPIKLLLNFPLNFSFHSSRNRHADPQILISDALQKQNHPLCCTIACDHRVSDGIPAVSHGHPDMSHLHRKLLVQQHKSPPQVGRKWRQHKSRAEAAAVQLGRAIAAGRDEWVHAREGRQLFTSDGVFPL